MVTKVYPFKEDFFERVHDINWSEGLAVEFNRADPSYLTLNKSLPMNKVTISFWFRVPKESADAVKAATSGFYWDFSVFGGVIPLLTWGPQPTPTVYEIELYDSGSVYSAPFGHPIMLERVSGSHSAPMQMSSIGVYVDSSTPALDVNIQTNVYGSGVNLRKIATGFTGLLMESPDGWTGGPIYSDVEFTYTDVSYVEIAAPEFFGNSQGSGAGYPDVTVDEWHHVLISWDLRSHSNTAGASTMWCAIDDVNKAGFDLPAYNDMSTMGPNDHVTWNVFRGYVPPDGSDPAISVAFGDDDVPSDPYRTPGPPTVNRANNDRGGVVSIAPIATVELAELQIFTGVTCDTGVESRRRAFIDFERDEDGNIVAGKDGSTTMEPVDPLKAEKMFHKKPEILLHGSSKWIKGSNTGTTGVDYNADPPAIKLDGQFKPSGKIEKYTPDPTLPKPA